MPTIRVPNVGRLTPVGEGLEAPVQKNDFIEYEVSIELKTFWDSLSPRERETLWNRSLREHKDLRDVLSSELK